jgi:hypothetical protein
MPNRCPAVHPQYVLVAPSLEAVYGSGNQLCWVGRNERGDVVHRRSLRPSTTSVMLQSKKKEKRDATAPFSVWTQFTMCTSKKVDTREECHWAHACKSFKRAGVGTNGFLEGKILSKMRTVRLRLTR